MATRHCGALRISVRWDDSAGHYKARVSGPDGRWHGAVGTPPAIRVAVDSPEGYDDAAHAAVSFAVDESPCGGLVDDADVTPDGRGWRIERPAQYRMRIAAEGGR